MTPTRFLHLLRAFLRARRELQSRKRLGLPVQPLRIPLPDAGKESK